MDAGRLQILYHIIEVLNPVLGVSMSIILRLAARIEMQRTVQIIELAREYTPADPVRRLLMTHIYIRQIEAGIECIAAEFLYRLRQINLLQHGCSESIEAQLLDTGRHFETLQIFIGFECIVRNHISLVAVISHHLCSAQVDALEIMTRQLIKIALVNLTVHFDISVYKIVRIFFGKCLLQRSSPRQVDRDILFLIVAISLNLKGINRFNTSERIWALSTQIDIINQFAIQFNATVRNACI